MLSNLKGTAFNYPLYRAPRSLEAENLPANRLARREATQRSWQRLERG